MNFHQKSLVAFEFLHLFLLRSFQKPCFANANFIHHQAPADVHLLALTYYDYGPEIRRLPPHISQFLYENASFSNGFHDASVFTRWLACSTYQYCIYLPNCYHHRELQSQENCCRRIEAPKCAELAGLNGKYSKSLWRGPSAGSADR